VWRKSVSQASPSSRESDTGPSNFRWSAVRVPLA